VKGESRISNKKKTGRIEGKLKGGGKVREKRCAGRKLKCGASMTRREGQEKNWQRKRFVPVIPKKEEEGNNRQGGKSSRGVIRSTSIPPRGEGKWEGDGKEKMYVREDVEEEHVLSPASPYEACTKAEGVAIRFYIIGKTRCQQEISPVSYPLNIQGQAQVEGQTPP